MADLAQKLQQKVFAQKALLEEIYENFGGKIRGACPVCSTYTHKHWCFYPHLASMLGRDLDEFDKDFLLKMPEESPDGGNLGIPVESIP